MLGQADSPVVDALDAHRIPITDEYGIKIDYQAPEFLQQNSFCSSLSQSLASPKRLLAFVGK